MGCIAKNYSLVNVYSLLVCELENGPVKIVGLPIENSGSFHSHVNVHQRVFGFHNQRWDKNLAFFGDDLPVVGSYPKFWLTKKQCAKEHTVSCKKSQVWLVYFEL